MNYSGARVYCSSCYKRNGEDNQLSQSFHPAKRSKKGEIRVCRKRVVVGWVDLEQFDDGNDDDLELVRAGCRCHSICLMPDQPYTIGRSPTESQLIFDDLRVSKQHCQLLLDGSLRKLYLLDGVFASSADGFGCVVEEFRNRGKLEGEKEKAVSRFKASLNGVFVNGVRVRRSCVVELSAGDKVTIAVGTSTGAEVGFLVKRIIFQEEMSVCDDSVLERPMLVQCVSNCKGGKRVFPPRENDLVCFRSDCDDVFHRATSLLTCCRRILRSKDPVSYIRFCSVLGSRVDGLKITDSDDLKKSKILDFPASINQRYKSNASAGEQGTLPCNSLHINQSVECLQSFVARPNSTAVPSDKLAPLEVKSNHSHEEASARKDVDGHDNSVVPTSNYNFEKDPSPDDVTKQENSQNKTVPPPGKKFYLNLLGSMQPSSFGQGNAVSLRELLHPLQSISRIFIATFTNDILWFLSYCKIPSHLPVTLVCHNTAKCWSTDLDSRCSVPNPDFPNLVFVYPPFPEAIAFGKDSKKQGVACHHPKLIMLQREDSIRVIISSANLNENQWNNVTNMVWWQDFPLRNMPDYSALFTQICDVPKDSNSDFAAQLAGFMARLLTDVPSQTYWITELAKYDFSAARGYLIPSVPGIHSYTSLSVTKDLQFLHADQCRSGSSSVDFIGSAEASVVGLSHLFRSAVDSKGVQLKKLASFLRRCEKAHRMARIVLRRNKNVPEDVNAVSILVPNPKDMSDGDCVQLGFLPRNVAKWVSPLWDIGFVGFTGFVFPEEALKSALEGISIKVQLILHLSKGPHFQDISEKMQSEHVVAFCSLIGSLQRSTGLWRLEEVLSQYNWPEHLESDFVYGASSIGSSVNAEFLAAFSSAAGKRAMDSFDSEESDPEWGRWNSSHEVKNPSIRIAFPTIERVKSAHNGVSASKYMLCMAERTWQRLKHVGILRDAVPYPIDRVGHPMHTKVARRQFHSNKKDGSSSFGWVYSGSHNFSAAAWGRPIRSAASTSKETASSPPCLRLHVCNYELGILFVFPPPGSKGNNGVMNPAQSLDDIDLPFVAPAPKYRTTDRPATKQAMKEAWAEEVAKRGAQKEVHSEMMEENVVEEEEDVDEGTEGAAASYVAEEKDEEKAYADMLWSQVDAS